MSLYHVDEFTFEAPEGWIDRTLNLFVRESGEVSVNITRDKLGDKAVGPVVDAQLRALAKKWPRFLVIGQRDCTVGKIAAREARMQWQPAKQTIYQHQIYVPYYGELLILTSTAPKMLAAQADAALARLSSTIRFRKMSS